MGKTYKSKIDWSETKDFTIGGTLPNGQEWSETFRLLPGVSPTLIDEASAIASINAAGGVASLSIINTLAKAIVPADRERWMAWSHDDDRLIDVDTLMEVFQGTLEDLFGRPLQPPSSSTNGALHGGTGSTPASSPGVLSPPTSTPPAG